MRLQRKSGLNPLLHANGRGAHPLAFDIPKGAVFDSQAKDK
jgi:hypothetical protein